MEISEIYVQSLLERDRTWHEFETDWRAQCEEAGEDFDDYAPDVLGVLANIAAERVEQTKLSRTGVCAFREGENGRFWAVCMLNWVAMLPGTKEPTLRVRHLLASPLIDFGIEGTDRYADTLIGAVAGILGLSDDIFEARQIRFHLRSPEDVNFFRVLGTAMGRSPLFETVETKGAWLYIAKAANADDGDEGAHNEGQA